MLLESGALEPADTDRAFPISALMIPDLTLEEWRDLARRREVVQVRNSHGYIVGLAICRLAGRRLVVEHAIAVGLTENRKAAGALVAAVELLARSHRCSAIHARLADSELQASFEAAGHAPKLVLTCKPIDCDTVRSCRPESCFEEVGAEAGGTLQRG